MMHSGDNGLNPRACRPPIAALDSLETVAKYATFFGLTVTIAAIIAVVLLGRSNYRSGSGVRGTITIGYFVAGAGAFVTVVGFVAHALLARKC